MWTKTHLPLWWSTLCSSHGLSHLYSVLARSSAGAFELLCVMKVAKSRSCWTRSLRRSKRTSVPFHLVCGCRAFSDSKAHFLAFHVSYFLNAAAVVRLAAEVSIFRSRWHVRNNRNLVPLLLVSLCNRDPKHQNTVATLIEVGPIPHFSRDLSLESAVRLQIALRDGRGSKTKWQRDGDSSSSSAAQPPQELKDGFLEQCLHGCIAWLKLLPSIKHMGLIYPCGSQWWCRKHQGPPQEEMKGEEEKEKCTKESADGTYSLLSYGAHLLNKFHCFITTK